MSTRYAEAGVLAATGKVWKEWYAKLDGAGGRDKSHAEIAKLVESWGPNGWWSQNITVEYEIHIGRRVVGQSCNGDYQVGRSRSFRLDLDSTWNLVFENPLWAGSDPLATLDLGESMPTPFGALELRTFLAPNRLRAYLHRDAGRTIVTIMLTATPKGTRVTIDESQIQSLEERNEYAEAWAELLGGL